MQPTPKLAAMAVPALLCACAQLLAQAPSPDAPATAAATPVETRRPWKAPDSRNLFAACDQDGDDRIDLLEYAAAFGVEDMATARDRFRRVDSDRDGFLAWSEFDAVGRAVARDGGTLWLQPCRSVENDRKEQAAATPASPMQQLLQLFDVDRSNDLSATEFAALVKAANLPPSAAASFSGFDQDGSKALSSAELEPVVHLGLPLLANVLKNASAALPLPSPYAEMDANNDGTLDAAELSAALQRCDGGLAAYAPRILAGLDKDRDGKLALAELAPATAVAKPSPALPTPRR